MWVSDAGNVGHAPVAGLVLRAFALTRQRVLGWQGWQAQCFAAPSACANDSCSETGRPTWLFLMLLICSLCRFWTIYVCTVAPTLVQYLCFQCGLNFINCCACVCGRGNLCIEWHSKDCYNLSGPCNDQSMKSIINCFQRHLSAKFCHHMHTGILVYSSNSSACERCRAGWESWLGNTTKQTR